LDEYAWGLLDKGAALNAGQKNGVERKKETGKMVKVDFVDFVDIALVGGVEQCNARPRRRMGKQRTSMQKLALGFRATQTPREPGRFAQAGRGSGPTRQERGAKRLGIIVMVWLVLWLVPQAPRVGSCTAIIRGAGPGPRPFRIECSVDLLGACRQRRPDMFHFSRGRLSVAGTRGSLVRELCRRLGGVGEGHRD
jgi:hypothetical protein